jgi:hypothetical protein
MSFHWRVPAIGVLRNAHHAAVGGPFPPPGPKFNGLEVRSPVAEQLGVQFGSGLSREARRLTNAEMALARSVFHDSVNLAVVRVVMTKIMSSPTTMGNVIRIRPFDPKKAERSDLDHSTLLHELTHVWQFQTRGAGYISNSLWRQGFTEGRDAAYAISAAQLRYVSSIADLSAERQARVVELYFVSTLLGSGNDAKQTRARVEFRDVSRSLSDPDRDPDLFAAECQDLERLIGEIRRARPISSEYMYQESLNADATPFAPATMPFFRIQF